MAYIWTSKTRSRKRAKYPHGTMQIMRRAEPDETGSIGFEIVDERKADQRLARHQTSGVYAGDPTPAPRKG